MRSVVFTPEQENARREQTLRLDCLRLALELAHVDEGRPVGGFTVTDVLARAKAYSDFVLAVDRDA